MTILVRPNDPFFILANACSIYLCMIFSRLPSKLVYLPFLFFKSLTGALWDP